MSFRVTLLVAALGGFISLSYEVLWFRVYSFASGGSPAAFGLLLGYYLAGLAVGAYVSGKLCSVPRSTPERRIWTLIRFAFVAVLAGYAVIPTFAALSSHVSPGPLLFPIAVAAGCFGAMLPLISHLGIVPDDRSGARLARVYLANIAGSASGTLLTGYILLEIYTTSQLAMGLAFAGLALVVALVPLAGPDRLARPLAFAAVAIAGVVVTAVHPRIFDRLYERLLFKEADNGDRFANTVENRQGVIAVLNNLRVYGGGAYDGVISTDLVNDRNILVRAFGAVALHPQPKQVLMIGLSTGAWAQVIANAGDVYHLTVVEINPGYLRLIEKYAQVRSVLTNPKVTIVIDDGRRWLVHNPRRRFDLIVQNTTEHWRAHTTNLLSREYLDLVRAHLSAGGIFHFNTTDSQDAFKTAFLTFPYGLRFVNFASVSDVPIKLDSARWRNVLTQYRIDGRPVLDLSLAVDRERLDSLMSFARSIDRPPQFVGLESRASTLGRIREASVITDDNMLPEWRALLLPH